MSKQNAKESEVKNFKNEKMLSDHPKHNRHVFSLTVDENEFKGHFHESEITWMHPHPKQMYGEEEVEAIEQIIHELLSEHGIPH